MNKPMETIMAIDPGPTQSAFAIYNNGNIAAHGKWANDDVKTLAREAQTQQVVIEEIRSYGMPVGIETFDTVRWVGRFQEAAESAGKSVRLLPRQAVKLHLCKSTKANDATIRQALIDRFGPGKEKAIGLKKSPGPLYGVKADIWSAIAIAVTASEVTA